VSGPAVAVPYSHIVQPVPCWLPVDGATRSASSTSGVDRDWCRSARGRPCRVRCVPRWPPAIGRVGPRPVRSALAAVLAAPAVIATRGIADAAAAVGRAALDECRDRRRHVGRNGVIPGRGAFTARLRVRRLLELVRVVLVAVAVPARAACVLPVALVLFVRVVTQLIAAAPDLSPSMHRLVVGGRGTLRQAAGVRSGGGGGGCRCRLPRPRPVRPGRRGPRRRRRPWYSASARWPADGCEWPSRRLRVAACAVLPCVRLLRLTAVARPFRSGDERLGSVGLVGRRVRRPGLMVFER